jgi:hypothetical protein
VPGAPSTSAGAVGDSPAISVLVAAAALTGGATTGVTISASIPASAEKPFKRRILPSPVSAIIVPREGGAGR